MRWWHYFYRVLCTWSKSKTIKTSNRCGKQSKPNHLYVRHMKQQVWIFIDRCPTNMTIGGYGVCVWVLFVFLHLISVTLVLRLILWWFCDRIYKCGGFFLSLLERVSHAKRAVEAVRWSCKRLLRWWWSKICVCIFIVCHGERSDATTMPTKAVVDGCEKC